MGWSSLPLLTDDDLGRIESEAIHPDEPWGAATWPSERGHALRQLGVWIDADFGPGASDRVLDRWSPDAAYRFTGGAYVDITNAVSDDTEEDVDLAAALATAATDRIYIGMRAEFGGLVVKVLDSLNAVSSTMTVKYWGPTGWTALTISDGTAVSGATCGKSGRVVWSVPSNWERRRLAGTADEYFWVEMAVSVALTSGTSVTQLLPTRRPEGLSLIAAYLALGTICHGRAPQAANPEEWRARGERYANDAAELYARLKNGGSLVIDTNNDQVLQPSERHVVRPVRVRRG